MPWLNHGTCETIVLCHGTITVVVLILWFDGRPWYFWIRNHIAIMIESYKGIIPLELAGHEQNLCATCCRQVNDLLARVGSLYQIK